MTGSSSRQISDSEFGLFQRFIHDAAGISLSEAKKALVSGRLARRLAACRVNSYAEYFRLVMSGDAPEERQTALDLLTTNETYFFREPKHFEFLKKHLAKRGPRATAFRAWSAAGSTGEEAYSIAMLLADCLGEQPWEVLASDISARVLERARSGHYALQRLTNFPPGYLQRFCLKGIDTQEGTLLIDKSLRNKVRFLQVNLNAPLPALGQFDIIFLRNVLIYFNLETKRKVIERVLTTLKPGGWLLIGHSESLNEVSDAVELVSPAIYRRKA